MCLIDKKQFRVAEKDIPIFKVVLNGNLSPIFKTRLWCINNISITLDTNNSFPRYLSTVGDCNKNFNFNGKQKLYRFNINFFFAFLQYEKAEEFLNSLSKMEEYTNNLSIITGYIPEGTRYAIDNSGYICARKMILNL